MFEILNPLAADLVDHEAADVRRAVNEQSEGTKPHGGTEPRRIVLPRRLGESRLAPPQYYYPASKTGVVPSWVGDAA